MHDRADPTPLRPLASLFKRAGIAGDYDPGSDPDFIERMLLERPLLPADLYAAKLAIAQSEIGTSTGARRAQLGTDIELLERNRDLALLRERLSAARPPGCWCYGLGGTEKRWLPSYDESDPIPMWTVWCSCPESQAQQRDLSRTLNERTRRLKQRRAERLFGSLPDRFRDWTFQTLLDRSPEHAQTVAQVEFFLRDPDKWALVLRGDVGVGKTGLGVSALRACVEHGDSALYVDTATLLARLRPGNQLRILPDEMGAYWQALFGIDVLMLDDLGAERDTDWAVEQLWVLIGNRHSRRLRTIVTSNHSLQELSNMFGHARISSRLSEESLVINCSDLPMIRQ